MEQSVFFFSMLMELVLCLPLSHTISLNMLLSFLERGVLYTTVSSFSTESPLTFHMNPTFSYKYRKILLLEDFNFCRLS